MPACLSISAPKFVFRHFDRAPSVYLSSPGRTCSLLQRRGYDGFKRSRSPRTSLHRMKDNTNWTLCRCTQAATALPLYRNHLDSPKIPAPWSLMSHNSSNRLDFQRWVVSHPISKNNISSLEIRRLVVLRCADIVVNSLLRLSCPEMLAHSGEGMMVISKRSNDAHQMRTSTHQHEYMKPLVWSPHDVEFARVPAFGYPARIDYRAAEIKDTFQDDVFPTHLQIRLCDTKSIRGISHWYNSTETKGYKHARAEGFPSWRAAIWYCYYHCTDCGDGADL